MKEQIISFDTAKLAKEKGFDWQVRNYFRITSISKPIEEDRCTMQNINAMKDSSIFSRPTQSLLQRWLREKHKIHIDLWYNDLTNKWRCECLYLLPLMEVLSVNCNEHPTYEEALEEGLQEGLKLIPD